ncbi:metallophosphoesterase [Clostridium disporicum]|uniref:Phosphoesterase n=1 Tax=Clostridium disporicum TaxID=84024 RepID=A0A174J122_9CLOT|nr:metallophosphoesterase [Clostridium disporicum]CUO90810.1 phosphoesterase [Clostridium disporicum]
MKGKNKKVVSLVCLILVVMFICIYFIVKVDIINYSISDEKVPQEFNDFKIVQISDFHSKGYKDTTNIIINKIEKINPDIIVMTGDMIRWDVENIGELEKLINELTPKYPTYYINGNHEELAEILKGEEYSAFLDNIKLLGVTVIKDNYVEVTKEGQSINLYEVDIPLDGPTGLYMTREELDDNYIKEILPQPDSSKFNILLAHNPLFIEEYSDWGADLVLSGHMHGGIIRIPIIGVGIASPEGNYFPKYDAGEFKVDDTTMIVNRGIGTSSSGLRVFNKPEISVITLKSK